MPFIPDPQPAKKSSFVPDADQQQPDPPHDRYTSPGESPDNGSIDNFKARISDPNRLRAMLTGKGPAAPEVIKGTPPMVIPGASAIGSASKTYSALQEGGQLAQEARAVEVPGVVQKASDLVNMNAPTRIAAGAAQGAASDPARPYWGAAKGGAMALGGEAVGGLMRLFGKGTQAVGGHLANMSSEETKAYTRNPELAEEVYNSEHNTPDQFNKDMQTRVKESAQKLQEGVIDPSLAELSRRGVGKSIQVNPSQFEGTEAGKEIKDTWNKQGQKINVPVSEPYKVEASPLEMQLQPSSHPQLVRAEGEGQFTPVRSDMSGAEPRILPVWKEPIKVNPPIATQMYENRPVPTKPEVVSEGLLDRGTQQIPAPMPKSVKMFMEPALRAQRASSAAADLPYKSNPNGVSVPDAEQARKEAQAAMDFRKAITGVDPESAKINSQVSEAIRNKENVMNLGNSSRILSSGDTIGNMPMRALQDYLDTNTGSNYQDLSRAYSAGKAIHDPNRIKGWFDRLATVPIGRALVRQSPKLFNASQTIRADRPSLRDAILNDKTGAAKFFGLSDEDEDKQK